jgi:hypothetical protein
MSASRSLGPRDSSIGISEIAIVGVGNSHVRKNGQALVGTANPKTAMDYTISVPTEEGFYAEIASAGLMGTWGLRGTCCTYHLCVCVCVCVLTKYTELSYVGALDASIAEVDCPETSRVSSDWRGR